jgi:hypothetical protein
MTLTRKRLLAGVALVAVLAVLGAGLQWRWGADDARRDHRRWDQRRHDDPSGRRADGGTYRAETDGIAWTSGGDPTGEYLGIAFGLFSNLLGRTLLTYPHRPPGTPATRGAGPSPRTCRRSLPTAMTYTYHLKDGNHVFGDPLNRTDHARATSRTPSGG